MQPHLLPDLGTRVMIVLSSAEVVKDLLDKRSSIYSTRAEAYAGTVVSGGLRVVLMVSGSASFIPLTNKNPTTS
jgi:hypothetical protein